MDHRPANCRFRLQDEGKGYPKSACKACGKTIMTGLGKSCSMVTEAGLQIEPDSVWAKHGEEIATKAMRAVHALQRADWIDSDVDSEDLAGACMIIADAFAVSKN